MSVKTLLLIGISISFFACKKSNNTTPTPPSTVDNTPFVPGTTLTIAKAADMGNPRVAIYPDTAYCEANPGIPKFKKLPAGFDDAISSFYLPKGYMAVFAENSDGSGESFCYVAAQSPIKVNFAANLLNKVSFVRYITIDNPTKKGVAFTDSSIIKQFSTSWYYGWSINRPSFGAQNFIPMTWGRTAASLANVDYLVGRKDVNHLLSFNEPDNSNQSNIPVVDTAINRYKIMMRTGLRLGSPAVEQDEAINAGKWLPTFMSAAKAQKLRVDFVALHWYDWGNENSNQATDSLTAVAVFNRFKTYMERARAAYPDQKLWVTEYNSNPSRKTRPVVVKYFMKLSTDWMNATPYVERYAYFLFGADALTPTGSLNDVASYWNSLTSPAVFPVNIE